MTMSLSQACGRPALVAAAGLFFLAAGAVAQTAPAGDAAPDASAVPSLRFDTQSKAQLDLRVPEDGALAGESSSSSGDTTDVAKLDTVELGALPAAADGNMQPPPYRRRRYGQPNYNDRWHNKDGSNRLAFVVGGGFDVPAGATGKRLDLSYSLKGGAGINFSRKLGALVEFNFDRFGLQGSELANQYNVYTAALPGVDFSGLDASSYIWSFTVDPTITVVQGEKSSAYVVVGGGFYHKVVNFSLPQVGTYCDPYYGCYTFQQNQTFDHYANNAGGVNGGIGFTYKHSRFSNQKVFAEARYVEVFNSQDSSSQNSLYPPANDRTGYFPVTVGLRW